MLSIINIRHNFSDDSIKSEQALQDFYYIMQLIMSKN